MAGKVPAFQFYTGDWLKDPELSKCAPATRGIWMDLLCAMHETGRLGELSGTAEQLARLCRCSTADLSFALDDLRITRAADVTARNGVCHVVSRRMKREADARKSAADRQKRHRMQNGNGHVTEKLRALSSSSASAIEPEPEPKCVPPESVFRKLTAASLGNPPKLLQWHAWAANQIDPLFSMGEADQIATVQCAIWAIREAPGDAAIAVFAKSRPKWKLRKNQYLTDAKAAVKTFNQSNGVPE